LFLDEVGNMPAGQQAKLLRVLQTGEFHPVGSSRVKRADVRVISATNADLGADIRAGRFREDLLYRLNTVEIRLPPLRERLEDVPELAQLFLSRTAVRYGRPNARFHPDALDALVRHAWPGNVRELEHAVERALLMSAGVEIRREDLALASGHREPAAPVLESLTLEEVERHLIQKALTRCQGNVTEAARELGLSRSALYRRLTQHGLQAAGE
jgi:DNA-binding NtrC family response regulator